VETTRCDIVLDRCRWKPVGTGVDTQQK